MTAIAPAAEHVDDETAEEKQPSALLQLPLFEGHRTVEARLNFGGNILVTDKSLVERLRLGEEVEFTVKGHVVSRGFKSKGDGQAISSAAVVVDEISPSS